MTKTAYTTQKIFFALGVVCTLTVFGGNHLKALESAKARIIEIHEKAGEAFTAPAIGYAAQEARQILLQAGVAQAVIQLGDTVVNIGCSRRIGIQHPFRNSEENFAYVELGEKAMFTLRTNRSADDPRKIASVTLIGSNALQLGALCAKVAAMTIDNAVALLNNSEIEAIIVTASQRVVTTRGLREQGSKAAKAA